MLPAHVPATAAVDPLMRISAVVVVGVNAGFALMLTGYEYEKLATVDVSVPPAMFAAGFKAYL